MLGCCSLQLLETVNTMRPTTFGLDFQLIQASFAVTCSLFTSSRFQVVPALHLFDVM